MFSSLGGVNLSSKFFLLLKLVFMQSDCLTRKNANWSEEWFFDSLRSPKFRSIFFSQSPNGP